MAPNKNSLRPHDAPSTPLADYFWIAGLDGQDLLDTYVKLADVNQSTNRASSDLNDIIVEDEAAEAEVSSLLESPRPASKQSKRNSYQRLSRQSQSDETHISRESSNGILSGRSSARSSATIRCVTSSFSPRPSTALSDVDFDKALKNFANDRDSFFLDVNFSAGAVAQPNRPRPRPRTQKIVAEDQSPGPSPGLSRGIGSVRRHMSFREMNSTRRQSSVARQGWSFLFGSFFYPFLLIMRGSLG